MSSPKLFEKLFGGGCLAYVPVVSHYWVSMFRRPIEFLFPGPRGVGGFKSLKRIRAEHNFVIVIFVITFFSSVLRIMDRVEQNVLPRTSDPRAFKTSFSSDFTMLSVTAAIIAQVAITALALPNINQVHWTATAGLVTSLVTGCMSVWVSTTVSRLLTSLDSADAIRDWLSKPASKNARLGFEKELKVILDAADLISTEEVESIQGSIYKFLEDNKWKLPSFYSCTMLTAPSLLLNVSLSSFLLALGIYLGTVWKKNLDPIAGNVASRSIMICYIVFTGLACALFFGSSSQKEAETDFLRRWRDDLEQRAEVRILGTDIEARGNSVGTLSRRELTGVDNIKRPLSPMRAGSGGKVEAQYSGLDRRLNCPK
jgi:hypothetical protein